MEGFGSFFLKRRYGVDDPVKVERARAQVVAAMDRLDAELGDGDYLVGDAFTVADLTAASLFYPLVRPPEGPQVIEGDLPVGLERFAAPLRDRRGYAYVEEMFARHRNPAVARRRHRHVGSRPHAMSDAGSLELVRRLIEALNAHDVDAYLALCGPDVELYSPISALEGRACRRPRAFTPSSR